MHTDEMIMERCLELAAMGKGSVAPNPMVGALLVHQGKIIGEGYHEQYGKAHAEVNCLNSVPEHSQALIPFSTLYVSLEPCVHFGKTPPCTDLIISKKIPKVVVGCTDPFARVSGKGIAKMREAGIEVIAGIKEEECRYLNRRFFTYHQKKRPYIILKWAQTADGYMALPGPRPVRISNEYTDRLVHRWRSEEQAILAGSNTVLLDDPRLTNRLWTGKSPVRMVIDRALKLSPSLRLFDDASPAIIYNNQQSGKKGSVEWIKVASSENFLREMMADMYEREFISVLVEGGASLLNLFIKGGLWDEARIIIGNMYLKDGLAAPVLRGCSPIHEMSITGDRIIYFQNS